MKYEQFLTTRKPTKNLRDALCDEARKLFMPLRNWFGSDDENWLALMKKYFEDEIRQHGFRIEYAEYCEDAETPGLLGHIKGKTNWKKKVVKISTKSNPTAQDLCDTLAHELKHVEDPSWDCGNRDVVGRGGPDQRNIQPNVGRTCGRRIDLRK